jgi:hypothetical protein
MYDVACCALAWVGISTALTVLYVAWRSKGTTNAS